MATGRGSPAGAGNGYNGARTNGNNAGPPTQQNPPMNQNHNGTPSPTDAGRWGYQQGAPPPPAESSMSRSRELAAPALSRENSNTPGVPGAFPKDTPPEPSRRPSGSRVCGKCGLNLTGQFVRALGDTYHLECFTCHVRPCSNTVKSIRYADLASRTATRSLHPNFSLSLINLRASIPYVKLITSAASTFSASNAGAPCGAPI